MMESAANMQAFLDELDVASRGGAEKEYAMVFEFAKSMQPDLEIIDAASRGYWLEQYRRSAFEFNCSRCALIFPTSAWSRECWQRRRGSSRWSPARRRTRNAGTRRGRLRRVRGGRLPSRRPGQPHRTVLSRHDPREGKDKWFSAHPLIPGVLEQADDDQPGRRRIPQAALICNFPGGKPGDPGLLQHWTW